MYNAIQDKINSCISIHVMWDRWYIPIELAHSINKTLRRMGPENDIIKREISSNIEKTTSKGRE